MARFAKFARNGDLWAILFTASWHWIYFLSVTLGQVVWYSFDIARLYHPVGIELARALASGRLPFWTPDMLAGFPLVAEGHAAAFYPPNLVLYKLFPASSAISYTTLLHLSWMAVGMYVCARSMRLSIASALLAGFSFSFNGFALEKIYHTPIIVAAAWLPWLIFLQRRFQRARSEHNPRAGIWFLLATLAFGAQLLAGFPQVALLSAMTLGVFGIWEFFESEQNVAGLFRTRTAAKALLRTLFWTALPLVLGIGIAAIQILPTVELIGYSTRNAAQSDWFLTEYSLPPAFLVQFIMPFAPGEPIDQTNEYWAYFGFLPFTLAIIGPFLQRNRRTIFLGLFALSALVLALGRFTPLYQLVYRLPVLGLFRTPARYVFLFLFAAVLLSAMTFEGLAQRLPIGENKIRYVGLGASFGAAVVLTLWLAPAQPIDSWLNTWKILPFVLALVALPLIMLAWARKITRQSFGVVGIGLVVLDLSIYAPPFAQTLNPTVPSAYAESVPRSVPALTQPGRVYTDVSIVPSVQALRASLYPNVALVYGKESVQAYSPLTYSRHEKYLAAISPTRLDLLNVRYLMVPLEPRFTDRTIVPGASLTLSVVNHETNIPPTLVSSIEIMSFTEQSANLALGTTVAEIVVALDDGSFQTFPLRIGIETDDWDYDRAKVIGTVQHNRAQVARSYPGFIRAFGRLFEAHSYLARYAITPARRIVTLNVQTSQPRGRVYVEHVSLSSEDRQAVSLATLTGKANFALTFMSDTVAAWENLDVLPRAFVVHAAEIADDDTAFARLDGNDFHADQLVLLAEGQPLQSTTTRARDVTEIREYQPEHVELRVTTDQPGYVVLTDSWYPGWNAFVDGRSVPIYRADVLFRAVQINPGTHVVVFEYRPMSLVLGAAISAASLLIVVGFVVVARSVRAGSS